jgi:ribonuclease T1
MQYSLRASSLMLIGLLMCLPLAVHAGHHRTHSGDAALAFISVAELPPEGRETLHLIKQGGPFPYTRDGVVFGNREHKLPQQPRAYYHEYTVKTAGAHDRGARRIICGPLPECYYSGDHYRTFSYIRE